MTRGIRLVFARHLRFTLPIGQVATLALVNMQPGCQLAKPAAVAVAPPSTLMVGSKCKYQNVLSFFSFSFLLHTTWWSFVCGLHLPLRLHHLYPHTSSVPGWTTFSTRLATSWIAVDTFCLLSSIFQIDWLRLLLLLSEQENNSKILCKYFVCIFHLIFNLLSFFMVFHFFSPPHLYDVLFLCLFQTHEQFMALWPRVFLFCWGWLGVALSPAAILMNSIDCTHTPTKFIFSLLPLLSYTKSKVNQSFLN